MKLIVDRLSISLSHALEKAITKIKERNSTDIYINKEVKKLRKVNNKILTKIQKLNKLPLTNRRELAFLKKKSKEIKEQKRKEFNNSVSNYWKKRIKNICRKNAKTMYLEINKLFRKKESLKLPTLKIKITDQNLLNKTNINASVFIIDNEGNFLISDEKQKLNLIAMHFAEINKVNTSLGKPQSNEFINKEANKIKSEHIS